ncbi:hypothetical protein ACKWTF_001169 [Chironomus riparius]
MKTGVVSLVIAIILIIVSQNEVDGASTTEIVTETYPTEEPTENDILKDIIYPTYISPELIDEEEKAILVINEIPMEMSWEMVHTINPELEYKMPWKLKNHRFKRV